MGCIQEIFVPEAEVELGEERGGGILERSLDLPPTSIQGCISWPAFWWPELPSNITFENYCEILLKSTDL